MYHFIFKFHVYFSHVYVRDSIIKLLIHENLFLTYISRQLRSYIRLNLYVHVHGSTTDAAFTFILAFMKWWFSVLGEEPMGDEDA